MVQWQRLKQSHCTYLNISEYCMSNSVNLKDAIKHKNMAAVRMPRYKCHKTVHAMPMQRGVYNVVRGWEIPDDEDPNDDGYLVVYGRGTEDEHVSWSPEHVFKKGYSVIE